MPNVMVYILVVMKGRFPTGLHCDCTDNCAAVTDSSAHTTHATHVIRVWHLLSN